MVVAVETQLWAALLRAAAGLEGTDGHAALTLAEAPFSTAAGPALNTAAGP